MNEQQHLIELSQRLCDHLRNFGITTAWRFSDWAIKALKEQITKLETEIAQNYYGDKSVGIDHLYLRLDEVKGWLALAEKLKPPSHILTALTFPSAGLGIILLALHKKGNRAK